MDAVPAAFLWLGKNLTQNVTLGVHTYFLHSNVSHDRPRASAYTTATCYSDLKSAAIYQLYLMYFLFWYLSWRDAIRIHDIFCP